MLRIGLIFSLLVFSLVTPSSPLVVELKPATLAAFDRYAGQREGQINGELNDASKFFWVDKLPEAEKQKAYANMRAGQIVIDKGKRTDIPEGIIHHWTGAGFIPGATLQQTIAFVQDYNHHAAHYQPDVAGYYRLFDAFVLPSVTEGTPVSAIESLASGTPVVANRVVRRPCTLHRPPIP